MRERSIWDGVIGVLLGCGWLSLAACQSPGSQPIIGPDGSAMAHVHCGGDQGLCFRLAGELCPAGYEMKPVLSGDGGNFLVRCRSGAPPVTAACLTPGSPSSSNVAMHPPGLMDPWPPAGEPASAAYPWPGPESSAAGRSKPGATGDVDIGY
jgi:hypothetical protein